MRFFAAIALCVAGIAMAAPTYTYVPVAYNVSYDQGSVSVDTLTCGSKLKAAGYTNLSSLPSFPNIGGFANVTGPDSDECGTCWVLSWGGNFQSILVVDSADDGFVVSEEAMTGLILNTTYPPPKEVSALVISSQSCL
ncbi:hypothetical protein WOLCODRAFT_23042 [Wolfiporia cocos MD-104 SS10]|uniref:Cerato-platanin n=1 Tax=Wolfiporia cocos (strain MD-104) TaxID=742152 RepID=A0A2H3JPU0_WOLCO|nr:hypothetical protein WOLCODRAFT_23042 [Wolfiporia cocos MD-104 SS10]